MRNIRRIVLHCTSGWPDQSTNTIKEHWKSLGWKQVGYHLLIHKDGEIEHLAKLSEITNGVAGFNETSVHISYIGGLLSIKDGKYYYGDTRSAAQKESIKIAVNWVFDELRKYQAVDDLTILGHRDLSKDLNANGKIEEREWVKVCPTFDAIEEFGFLAGKKGQMRLENRSSY